jgi:hypothetical protein
MVTKPPEMIVIGPGVFRVIPCKDQEYDGRIKYSTMTIEVHPDHEEQYQAQTLFHEIQHGIFETVGERKMNDDEGLVERVSHAWLNTLLSTPGLLDYLKELQERTRCVG